MVSIARLELGLELPAKWRELPGKIRYEQIDTVLEK